MSATHEYDLVVIGSGPAGEKGAAQAAYFHKKVALIESGPLGGVCVHTGTLPSKSLRESALYLSGLRTRAIQGLLDPGRGRVRVADLMAHKDRVCAQEAQRVRSNLDRHGVELIKGTGSLAGPNAVLVREASGGERVLSTRFVLLATGSRPLRPPELPFDGRSVLDSTEILALETLPTSMLVIGAGVIGCEYASIFAALGVRVTLVEPRDKLLPFVDSEVARNLAEGFAELGMDLRLDVRVRDVRLEGADRVQVRLSDGGILHTEKLLFAAGRQGNVEDLGLASARLQANKRGNIPVDHNYRTACPSIYAAGDLIGFPALASTSMDQARVAVSHAFGFKYKMEVAHLQPYGIYTVPELSMVGETEDELAGKGEPYEVGRAFFRDNARGRINGSAVGMLKIVFEPEEKQLLGVHIVGEQAAELVHIGMATMQHRGTIDAFIDAVYNYPTLSEAYKYAAYDGLGRLQRRSTAMKMPKMTFADGPGQIGPGGG